MYLAMADQLYLKITQKSSWRKQEKNYTFQISKLLGGKIHTVQIEKTVNEENMINDLKNKLGSVFKDGKLFEELTKYKFTHFVFINLPGNVDAAQFRKYSEGTKLCGIPLYHATTAQGYHSVIAFPNFFCVKALLLKDEYKIDLFAPHRCVVRKFPLGPRSCQAYD